MRSQSTLALVQLQCFLQATRDSGYKSAAYALAELIDNSIEASAEHIEIEISSTHRSGVESITVTDDGVGMSKETLSLALQFGGSTRFGSRSGSGRFGMGLPNSCVSQAKRVEVTSWESKSRIWKTHLDVDEFLSGKSDLLSNPERVAYAARTESGTVVRLTRCDRFQYKSVNEAVTRLNSELGRLFRNVIHDGISISINGVEIAPVDPLFLRSAPRLSRAESFGPPLVYRIRHGEDNRISTVTVVFSNLPLAKLHGLSNQQKNELGIAKGAGVSILRAGREIDYGWFFMGSKRKENYDDWWRCEIRFEPDLDEAFGVTHTKQGIRPTESLETLLAPDLERIARELNGRVRRQYGEIKAATKQITALTNANKRDHLLEPPSTIPKRSPARMTQRNARRTALGGLKYSVQIKRSSEESFYEVISQGVHVTVVLNELHPFYEHIYRRVPDVEKGGKQTPVLDNLQAMLAAAARAELAHDDPGEREIILKFRRTWSSALLAFLS